MTDGPQPANARRSDVMRERLPLLMPPLVDALAHDQAFAALPPHDQLADAVCQTSFLFRDTRIFDAFEQVVLPSFPARSPIKVASVGCSAGQEPYSLLLSCWPDRHRLEIHGFDINGERLAQAAAGKYSEMNHGGSRIDKLRALCARHADSGFVIGTEKSSGSLSIDVGDEARGRVMFQKFDIVESRLPEVFDVVFACDVLHHYNPTGRTVILGNIALSLPRGGWLMCEPANFHDDQIERRQYHQWMRDLTNLGFVKAEIFLDGYLMDDQTAGMQIFRRA